jgi:hypothetical protein
MLATSAESADRSPVVSQTYRFGDFVMTVTPQTPAPVRRVDAEARVPDVIPASDSQSAAQPLPVDATFDEAVPPQPGILPPAPMPDADPSVLPPGSVTEPTAKTAVPCESLPAVVPGLVGDYQSVYDAIPFSRAEYDANPTYRHDATMEFLFGRMRPTVIQRTSAQVDVNMPETVVSPWAYNPYGMNSLYYPFYSPGVRVYRGR